MSIAIGADEAAFHLKEKIKAYLATLGQEVQDYGVHNTDPSLYPDVAVEVAQAVAGGRHERAILLCGTGIGMAITANKVSGVRAAVCHDLFSTERSRKSNDCQVMTIGSRVVGEETAKAMVKVWLAADFEGGGSAKKVARIAEIEREQQRRHALGPVAGGATTEALIAGDNRAASGC